MTKVIVQYGPRMGEVGEIDGDLALRAAKGITNCCVWFDDATMVVTRCVRLREVSENPQPSFQFGIAGSD